MLSSFDAAFALFFGLLLGDSAFVGLEISSSSAAPSEPHNFLSGVPVSLTGVLMATFGVVTFKGDSTPTSPSESFGVSPEPGGTSELVVKPCVAPLHTDGDLLLPALAAICGEVVLSDSSGLTGDAGFDATPSATQEATQLDACPGEDTKEASLESASDALSEPFDMWNHATSASPLCSFGVLAALAFEGVVPTITLRSCSIGLVAGLDASASWSHCGPCRPVAGSTSELHVIGVETSWVPTEVFCGGFATSAASFEGLVRMCSWVILRNTALSTASPAFLVL